MDIQKLIQEQGPALVQQLTAKAGFLPDQAKSFLTQIAGKLVDLVKGGGFDLKSLLGGGDVNAIIGKLGLGEIASKVGIDQAKATQGAKVVLPGIMNALNQAGGLGGLAAGAGDLLKKAGGFFDKKS
jgi:uncharacterized protein YidB (DUF937 family)